MKKREALRLQLTHLSHALALIGGVKVPLERLGAPSNLIARLAAAADEIIETIEEIDEAVESEP